MAVFIAVAQVIAQKGVRDFYKVEVVEMVRGTVLTLQTEALEGEVLQDGVVEAEVGTPAGAVEVKKMIPVEEEEVLITPEQTSKINVVTTEVVMVR